MKEIFIEIEGFEGLYEVSNLGNVRRIGKKNNLKNLIMNNGYARVDLSKNGITSHKSVHRLVASAFIDNHDNLSSINHKDLNKLNNYSDNLEWCSCKQNSEHASKNDRFLSEENHHSNVLSKEDVLSVLQMSSNGLSSRSIGKMFGVSKTTVLNIINCKRWVKFLTRNNLSANTEIINRNNILLAS